MDPYPFVHLFFFWVVGSGQLGAQNTHTETKTNARAN